MDEFFKTKVGFTIGLLAAVFAFKPLVDSNSDIGFSIFKFKITLEYAYIALTAFLGFAVYFISLQFASSRHVKILDKISDACYSAALATPPVFLFLWVTTIVLGYIATYISQIPEGASNFLAGVLSSIFAVFTYNFLKKSIEYKFFTVEKEQERKVNLELLSRAQDLFNSGMYDMSVLESSKIVESLLRSLLASRGITTKHGRMLELVRLSEEHRILSNQDIKIFDEIRKKRNESVHAIDAIDRSTAERVLNISRDLISKLDFISSFSSYEWIERNREKVLSQFEHGDIQKCSHALDMLKEAWRNRDGAIWLELTEFFEIALLHHPELIVFMYRDDEELLDSWLESAPVQLFTDFLGGDKNRLTNNQIIIISKLQDYIHGVQNATDRNIACKILDVIQSSEVREID
jgi:HEPN domain-containing protein